MYYLVRKRLTPHLTSNDMEEKVKIEKPADYKSYMIVYDDEPRVVINFTTTIWQKYISLPQFMEIQVEETDTHLIVTEAP